MPTGSICPAQKKKKKNKLQRKWSMNAVVQPEQEEAPFSPGNGATSGITVEKKTKGTSWFNSDKKKQWGLWIILINLNIISRNIYWLYLW